MKIRSGTCVLWGPRYPRYHVLTSCPNVPVDRERYGEPKLHAAGAVAQAISQVEICPDCVMMIAGLPDVEKDSVQKVIWSSLTK